MQKRWLADAIRAGSRCGNRKPTGLNDLIFNFPTGYTGCMYGHFKQLRSFGKRKTDRDISSDPGVVGHISIFRQGNQVVAAAYAAGGTGQPGAILPLLYRAKLVTMQGDGMLLQGWERPLGYDQPDTDQNKREWSLKLFAGAPPPSVHLG